MNRQHVVTWDELESKGTHRHVYNHKDGSKTAYIHYVDGMEVWELNQKLWAGWKKVKTIVGEGEVC